MKSTVLAARKQIAIEAIASHAQRITGGELDLVTGLRGDVNHRQLVMLERIAAFLEDVQPGETAVSTETEDTTIRYTVEQILDIPGLTKTSIKAIEEAFNDSPG